MIFDDFLTSWSKKCSTGRQITFWWQNHIFQPHISVILRSQVNWTDTGFRMSIWSSSTILKIISIFFLHAHFWYSSTKSWIFNFLHFFASVEAPKYALKDTMMELKTLWLSLGKNSVVISYGNNNLGHQENCWKPMDFWISANFAQMCSTGSKIVFFTNILKNLHFLK